MTLDKWSMFMKFGSKDNLEQLFKGKLYMKNLRYYVNLEKEKEDNDIGDKYDGQWVMQDVTMDAFDQHTDEFLYELKAPLVSMDLGFLDYPVFCMFMLDHRNCVDENRSGDIAEVTYQFTKDQVSRLPNLGDYVLIIENEKEFIERATTAIQKAGYGYTRDVVNYHQGNVYRHVQEIENDNERIAFWKRQSYAYQQEYRIMGLGDPVDDHLCVDIGSLENIAILKKTEDVLKTKFRIRFQVRDE